MLSRIAASFALLLVLFGAPQAKAALVTISGHGTFGPTDNPSSVYQAGASFAFSIAVDSPVAENPSYDLYNASYTVGGLPLAVPVVVMFFDASDGGLFSLGFDTGDSLSFFGKNIGSSGTIAIGQFGGAVFGSAADYGYASIEVSSVPLPSSIMLLGSGFVLVALVRATRYRLGKDMTAHQQA